MTELLRENINQILDGNDAYICLAFPNWGESRVNDERFLCRIDKITDRPMKIVNDSAAGWAGSLVEQYVEMALCYVRLGEGASDLVIKEYPLDDMIRKAIRKYAGQLIRRKLRVIYEGTDICVLTDEKWLVFIIEQLLSNAVKYTVSGNVTITVDREKKQLSISDTGIGISPEDLPRIFEKGYTGYNGRLDKKSTGIGLYLCRTAADKLGHKLTAQSTVGKGSSFTIDLSSYPLEVE